MPTPRGEHKPHAMTPSEFAELWGQVEKETERWYTITLEHSFQGQHDGMKMHIEARKAGEGKDAPTEYQTLVHWPTSSHKSVLGLLYWALLDVASQVEAGTALAGVGS